MSFLTSIPEPITLGEKIDVDFDYSSILNTLYIEGIPPMLLACTTRDDCNEFYKEELAKLPDFVQEKVLENLYTMLILKKIELKTTKHSMYLLFEKFITR